MMKATTKRATASVAVACALALACGSVAFAAPVAGVGGAGAFDKNEGHTTVNVATDAGQLAAEVPLTMTVVANAQGGSFATGGTPTNYKLTNKSYFAIQVASVKAEKQTGWDYSDTALTAGSPSGMKINLGLKPGSATNPTTVTSAEVDTSGDTNWKVEAATDSAVATKTIAISGSTSPLSKSIGDTGEAAAKLTYTIQAATA